MAKNLTYGSKTNTRFAIKGVLSSDGDVIKYTNTEGEKAEINIEKCFSPFKEMPIEVSIVTKAEEDLTDSFEEG